MVTRLTRSNIHNPHLSFLFLTLNAQTASQRRPFGFSRSGWSKAQARLHASRRPATASARLSSVTPKPPNALIARPTEYWGPESSDITGDENTDVDKDKDEGGRISRAHATQRSTPYVPGARGPKHCTRPLSAGCRRSPPLTPTVLDATGEGIGRISAAVGACTRHPAGIVRGGGRCERSARPPTPRPPPPLALALATRPASAVQRFTYSPQAHDHHNKRRPSTAGQARHLTIQDREPPVRSLDVNGFATSFGSERGGQGPSGLANLMYHGDGVHNADRGTPSAGRTVATVAHPFPSGQRMTRADFSLEATTGTAFPADTDADTEASAAVFPASKQRYRYIYLPSGGASSHVTGRRRPASASPAHERDTHDQGDSYYSRAREVIGDGRRSSGGVVGLRGGAVAIRDVPRRPRSASVTRSAGGGIGTGCWRCASRNTRVCVYVCVCVCVCVCIY